MEDIFRYRIQGNAVLELLLGDISQQDTDAIVNAANSGLLGGGGVDGAIHRTAGPTLLAECRNIREHQGPLPPGKAAATSAGNLKARFVIHTVGPIWRGGGENEDAILESCYRSSLREAHRLSCSSISFPSVSTGVYGYPVDAAAQVALRAVVDELPNAPSVRLARFLLFDPRTRDAYARAARELAESPGDLKIDRTWQEKS
jgi:O-acetyl-ADP-ribose deacetylase (regulator of RNase III)